MMKPHARVGDFIIHHSYFIIKKKAQPVKTARILYKGASEQPMRAMEETMRQRRYQPAQSLQQQNSKKFGVSG
jgi:hypothetical protein